MSSISIQHSPDKMELLDGYYKARDHFYKVLKKSPEECLAGDGAGTFFPLEIHYGDFGEAPEEVRERTGLRTWNVKLVLSLRSVRAEEQEEQGRSGEDKPQLTDLGILYDQGRKCVMKGPLGIATLEKISEDDLEAIENDFDPIEAPPLPQSYLVQPEHQGKLIWLTGAPGLGKSTSAQILARSHGYVYYEADCFSIMRNPYIPLEVENPSIAQIHQKTLKGPGMEERKAIIDRWRNLGFDKNTVTEVNIEYYEALAMDISREKARVGGDWAVAAVLLKRAVRDHLRTLLGEKLVIVSLTMSSTDRRERVLARYGGDTAAADLMDRFENMMEDVEEDEPNTIEVKVDNKMTREEVVDMILDRLKQIY